VGAPLADSGAIPDRGTIEVFDLSVNTVTPGPVLAPATGGIGDKFGQAVTILDGAVIGGAPEMEVVPVVGTGTPLRQGAAFVFRREPQSGVWDENQMLAVQDGEEGENFGAAMAATDSDLVIGVPRRPLSNGFLMDAGAVITYRRARADGEYIFDGGFE
jgi:hypothetical protein